MTAVVLPAQHIERATGCDAVCKRQFEKSSKQMKRLK